MSEENELPADRQHDPGINIDATALTARLSELSHTAPCPICAQNVGWGRPTGIARVTLHTTEGHLEALPYACTHCGYLRLHVIAAYRDPTPDHDTQP